MLAAPAQSASELVVFGFKLGMNRVLQPLSLAFFPHLAGLGLKANVDFQPQLSR
jgi:hypothetical protein